jgi:hypothetical protein
MSELILLRLLIISRVYSRRRLYLAYYALLNIWLIVICRGRGAIEIREFISCHQEISLYVHNHRLFALRWLVLRALPPRCSV